MKYNIFSNSTLKLVFRFCYIFNVVPRTASHDSHMDGYDWFCYFPSRNFKGTSNPMFSYPYIGKNLFVSQYGATDKYNMLSAGWFEPPTKEGKSIGEGFCYSSK